ncbi:hypothetical protein J7K74_00070, partial [Candidatus Woesearchaeota archaeon]|nr:hypothetical protein [Candidatus Woesearchaeota archaeon]
MNKKVLLFTFMGLLFLYLLVAPITIAVQDADLDDPGELGCCCNIKTGEVYSSRFDGSTTYLEYCDLGEEIVEFTPLSDIEDFVDCEDYCRSFLGNTVRLVVNVKNTEGVLISGANVQVKPIFEAGVQPMPPSEDLFLPSSRSGSTDNNGQVVFNYLTRWNYTVTASIYNKCSNSTDINLDEDKEITLQIDITPCQTSCLCVEWGECHEENGEWIMN